MAASFTSNPSETWMPAGQPLIYTLQTSLTITDTFAFIVQVFENGTEIGKYYLKPNSNDRAHFDLNRVIQARTRVDEKVYGASTLLFDYSALPYTRSNGNMNKYEVKIGEYTGTEALAQATKYIYVMDGYEQVTSGLHPSFADYYGTASTKKFWLTDREPVNNVITIEAADDDEGFMAFINKDTVSDVTRLSFLLVPPTGSPTTVTKDLNTTNGAQLPSASSPTNGFLVYAGIMPAQVLTPIFSATSWKQITITPQNASGTQEGNVLSIIRDCTDYKDQAVQVAFANSRGGWDYLKFEGRPGRSITTEEKTYRKALGNYDATTYTFQIMYGGVPDKWRHIEFFDKVAEYTNKLWKEFTENGVVYAPISQKPFYLTLKDMNAQKLFNYVIQSLETSRNVLILKEVLRFLQTKKTKVALYTYDAILFDFVFLKCQPPASGGKGE